MINKSEKLTPIDYEILSFVNKHGQAHKGEIENYFKHVDSIAYRIHQLSQPIHGESDLPNASFLYQLSFEQNYEYCLTDLGRHALENHILAERAAKLKSKKEWIRYGVTTAISILALILSAVALYFSITY